MPALQRSSAPRGARFYEDGGEIMFVHVLDATSRIGPREATDADRAEHPESWRRYEDDLPDPATEFAPMVTFSDPADIQKEIATRAKGSKAPV